MKPDTCFLLLSRFQNRRHNSCGGSVIAKIIEILSGLIVATISALGYPGVVLMMGIESACIPLPSEIIMPFSGYLVYTGRFGLWEVAAAGAVGSCLVGVLAQGGQQEAAAAQAAGERVGGSYLGPQDPRSRQGRRRRKTKSLCIIRIK